MSLLRDAIAWIRDEVAPEGRQWEEFYRNRWQHDKVVRSTHGVNCTGGCTWNIHVKDGIVTWEMQGLDYPRLEAGLPPYEPRGCQRGRALATGRADRTLPSRFDTPRPDQHGSPMAGTDRPLRCLAWLRSERSLRLPHPVIPRLLPLPPRQPAARSRRSAPESAPNPCDCRNRHCDPPRP